MAVMRKSRLENQNLEERNLEMQATKPILRRGLTSAEFDALKRRIAEPIRPSVPERREAVATYKRLMAEVIED